MIRSTFLVILTLCLASSMVASPAVIAETMGEEMAKHPRIARAIQELEGAIQYMEAAPHNFGGHKAEAIRDSRKAIEQLRKALEYRERADERRGR